MIRAFGLHLVYEFRAGLRDKSLLLMNYLFPLAFFALMGGLMTKVNPLFGLTMIPAMGLFALMCSSLLAMPGALVAARDSGLLRSYRINGVPAWAVFAAPPFANLAHMALVTAVIAGAGKLLFGAPLPADPLRFCLTWLAASAALAGLGALIASIASSARAAILLSQLVYIPSIILGGLMMPSTILSPALVRLSLLFPATHAMRAFAGGPPAASSLLVLGLGAVASFAVALSLHEWDPKNTRPAARKFLGFLALAPFALSAITLT